MPASASRSPPHSQDSSWLVSNERRGNESAAPEQARTKRRRSTDSKNNSDDDEDNVRIRLPFPSPSPIEQDYSSSSKETGPQPVESELSLLPAKTELSPSQVMDVQTAAAETIVEAVSSEAKGMSASCDVAKAEGTEAQEEVSTARPSCSYTTMIMEVFHATSKTRLALSDIYTGIMHRYPYYRKAGKIWQSSIRHALSQSKFFGKVDRGPDEPGKGSLWILDPHQSNATPHPARKRKASVDYQHGTAGPAIASANSKGASAAAASASKLTCVKEESVGGDNNKSQGFHPMVMASIPSPAASDDTEDANTVRRSGRARRPPRTKEANDYVTTLHVRKPSLVVGVSLSTPPASPAPQDHHHAETTLMTPPPPTRKRSSSIRSDKSLSTPIVLRMSHVEIQAKEPTASATATAARKALMDDDDELAAVPGVVTSQRIRRPPQKLAEFVSSEDFKAAPYRKRPSISTTSAFSGDLDRDRTASTATSSRPPSEKRIRKRARPDGGNRRSIVEEPDQEEPMEMIPAQENTALPVPTAPSPGAPAAFISLKDLELSHASTSSRNHDGSGRVRRGTRFTSRHSCRQGPPRRDTYEQRRLAGIQQIVVASLDWYEESDSEADSDTDFGSGSGCSAPRSACNSGVDSGPDYPRGFVREGEEGWMVAEEHELTAGLDLNGGVTQLVDDRCQSEAFETVCITEGTIHSMMEVEETTPFLAPAPCTQPAAQVEWRSQSQQDSQNMVMDQAGLQGVVDEPSSVVDTSLLPILGDMSLFEAPVISEMADAIATDAAAGQQPAWVPNIPAGILKELVVNVEAEKSETGGNAVVPEVVVPMAVELEDSSLEEASVHSEAALVKVDNYMGWLNI
ncbi:Forkhead box protein K1 [Mortierella sp. AD031]|nr:Forkhead box protein K1 [Mortierella sp. AD031]